MIKPGLCATRPAAREAEQRVGLPAHRGPSQKAKWALGACLTAMAMLGLTQAGGEDHPVSASVEAGRFKHAVVIKRPPGPPLVATGLTNFHGQPVMATCGSCHATTKPSLETRRTEDLDQFHQGLNYTHGNLTCLSCHNSQDYETLRLADSRAIEFPDSMTLCSQCHGPQRRDYDMGLHGGMNGHWDLTRGGRTRNTCVDCHDPHSPAFPVVRPVLAPRDRASVPGKHTKTQATVPHP
ncbi:MAG TPA: hypothetical protein VN673_16230 [Clostridia bacterium]|nr:hypothetical protein [Clostridia bacterium]